MGKKFTKRMLALMIALMMVLTMVPAGAFSAEANAGYPVAEEYQTGYAPGGEVVTPDYSYPDYVVADEEYESGNDYADYEVDYDYEQDGEPYPGLSCPLQQKKASLQMPCLTWLTCIKHIG